MIQLQVLNYILDKQEFAFIDSNGITTEFFSDYPNEYSFIKAHYEKYGNVPDKVTFLSQFKNFDIIEVKEHINYLIDGLFADRNKRHMAKVYNKIRELLSADRVDEAMQLYTQEATNLVESKKVQSVDIFEDTTRYDNYVDKSREFAKFYVKTGFKELDEIIGGWDKFEELATLAARPNVGKSWMLLKVAIAGAEQGLRVGIYSGEMSELKVGYRIDTLISHISNRSIIHGNVEVQNDYKRYLDSVSEQIPGCIKILTPKLNNNKLAGVKDLKRFIEADKLDMLCIDQHSLLDDDNKAKNPIERAANISRDLKSLQVTMKIPIIAVSQQNRTSTENGVSTEHIAQSDRISQDSTIILFFEQDNGILTMNLVKSRDSENNKKIKYAVDFDKGIFSYIPTETDALSGSQCDTVRDEYEFTESDGEDTF